MAAAAAPNIEPPVVAGAGDPNGLAGCVLPPPNIEPVEAAPNPVGPPPPKILPPVAAGGLVAAAAAANKPVPAGCAAVLFAAPNTDCSGLGIPPKILPPV